MKNNFILQNFVNIKPFELHADVEIIKEILKLRFKFITNSNLSDLILFAKTVNKSSREDNLWQKTCFEIFLKDKRSDSYIEYNFSPCGAWNAYKFESERSGMMELTDIINPVIINKLNSQREIIFEINLNHLEVEPKNLKTSICAVIETSSKELFYYSTKHVGQKPDFHKAESFIDLF